MESNVLDDVDVMDEVDIQKLEENRVKMLEESGINEEDVLKTAHENTANWYTYFNENITRGKEDLNFLVRDQWNALERSEFSRLFKPAMTFNKLAGAVNKMVGEQRKNKPDLMVRSLTGNSSQEQVTLRSDLVRTWAYNSQTDLVYQAAFKSAASCGYGALQIELEYESAKSFNQIPVYKVISDATSIAFDPTATKPHKGDGNYCARRYHMSMDVFNATYPYIQNPISYLDPQVMLDLPYSIKDIIFIANYFVKEWYPTIVYRLSNGQSVFKSEWEEMQKTYDMQMKITSESEVARRIISKSFPTIVAERQSQDYKLMNYHLIKNRIIDFCEYPGKFLPMIYVDGDSSYIDGQQYTRSYIHEAKDAQRFVNYVGSEIGAEIKNRRREQWIGTPDNIMGQDQMWRNPELQNGILLAKPDPKTGQMPTKMPPWDLSPALLAQYQRGTQDIREILGSFEASQPDSRDISGASKRERKIDVSMNSYVFFDNLNQAIEQGGRVILDLLPYCIGHEEKPFVVSKADGKKQNIILNQKMEDGTVNNKLEEGEFDIEIDTGPSFTVQKEIALEFLQTTLQAFPQAFPLVADLWAKNLDVQFMPQMAERFKTLVPPEILAKEEGQPPPPPKPNPQEEMAKVQQQLATQELQQRAAELKIRQEKHDLEKVKLIMDAQKMQSDMQMNKHDKSIEIQKAELDYSAKIAKVIADAHA